MVNNTRPLKAENGNDKPLVYQHIHRRIVRNKNFIAAITGPTGSGKSYSGLSMGEALDPDFTIDNVVLTPEDFMNLVNGKTKRLKKGSVIFWDEMQVNLSNLDFQSFQAKAIVAVLQTFRHKNIILLVSTPFFTYINASARKLFHSRMETAGIDYKKKKVKLKPYMLQWSQTDGSVYSKWLRVLNEQGDLVPIKSLKVGMPSQELLDAYELKKNAFTSKLNFDLARELEQAKERKENKDIHLTAHQKEILDRLQRNLTVDEIAKEMGVENVSIYQGINFIRKKGVRIRPVRKGGKFINWDISGF